MLTTYSKLQLFALMTKYNVDVISYSPGNVVVQIGRWWQYQAVFEEILEEIKKNPQVYALTVHENTISAIFDPHIVDSPEKLSPLFMLIKKYQL